jgi:hypothetical protein
MKRRDLMFTLGGPIALSLVGPIIGYSLAASPEQNALGIFRAFSDPDAAAALCRYLPQDAQIGRNPREAANHLETTIQIPHFVGADLGQRLVACIRQDYGDGRILVVQGWTMSLTEARLAAVWRDV